MKYIKMSILRPLTFKCVILERVESLKKIMYKNSVLCHPAAVFHINLRQEPMSRNEQLSCIPVTVFSQTDLFLEIPANETPAGN